MGDFNGELLERRRSVSDLQRAAGRRQGRAGRRVCVGLPAASGSAPVRPHAAAGQDSQGRDRASERASDHVGTGRAGSGGRPRVITFLKKIFLIDLVKGLWVTLKYTPQPAFTFQYPAERRPTAPRFRGVLRLQTEPATGAQTCIVCDQCAKACPDDLIALGGHREPGQKIKILDYFDFNLSRCSFCGLCSEVCPTKPIKALIMSEDYELGSYSRETQILRVDQMCDGVPIEQYTH